MKMYLNDYNAYLYIEYNYCGGAFERTTRGKIVALPYLVVDMMWTMDVDVDVEYVAVSGACMTRGAHFIIPIAPIPHYSL